MALFDFENTAGIIYILRWLHYFFGVIWIGHLYYFNFVQGSFMNEVDASIKPHVLGKLLPRAMWWFRWGAIWTMTTGLLILAIRGHVEGHGIFMTSWGVCILTGALLGLTMGTNVWMIIWPKQRIVIENAGRLLSGQPANPEAAQAAPKALLASRSNALFSIPMLFFMGAGRHLPIQTSETSQFGLALMIVVLVIAAIEMNAIKGKLEYLKITTVKDVITGGFVLTAVLYGIVEAFL